MTSALARAWLLVALLLGTGPAWSQLPVPALTGRVVDQTGTLAAGEIQSLSRKLEDFEIRKGSQIAVLVVPTTAPESIEQFSIRVADQWKLGRKKVDDGAILVVAKEDRAVRIEVGYGLEGALTDATSNRIIDEIIVPRFKTEDLAGGVDAGVAQMMAVVDGEPLPAPPARNWQRRGSERSTLTPIIFLAALLAGVLPAVLGRLGGSLVTGALVGGATWFFAGALSMAILAGVGATMLTLLGGLGLFSAWGGGYRGGRGWGGGGGGGGGGFGGGGGGFGGGGASGKW